MKLFSLQDCCNKLTIEHEHDKVYDEFPGIFTTYSLMRDNVTFMSDNRKFVIRKCGEQWNIAKSDNR